MTKSKINFKDNILFNGRIGRRQFIKKAGLFAVSAGITPYFIGCDDSEPKFYFAVISDTHITPDESSRTNLVMQATAEIFNNYKVPIEFVMISGDLCNNQPSQDREYYNQNSDTHLHRFCDYLKMFKMPVHPCMGNHDYYVESEGIGNTIVSDKTAREQLYIDFNAIEAAYYSKEYYGIKFYCLNSMQTDPSLDWEPEGVGCVGPDQVEWLNEEMSDNKPSFFFFHHPLATHVMTESSFLPSSLIPFELPNANAGIQKYASSKWKDHTDLIYPEFLDVRNRQIKGVFVGHSHWFVKDTYNSIPCFMTDAMKETRAYDTVEIPMRYYIVECSANSGSFNVYNEDVIFYGADALTA